VLDRIASGNPRSNYASSQLPTRYVGNETVVNANASGLIQGRPWEELLFDVLVNLSETAGSFYLLGHNWVAEEDYAIEQYIYFSGSQMRLTGNIDNFDSRVLINANGSIAWKADNSGASVGTPSNKVPVNKFSLIRAERIGSVGNVYVNDTLAVTATVPTGSVIVNTNGNQGGSTTDSLLANLNLIDLTTPANSLYFKLNELTGKYEYPVGNVFGSEEVSNNTFVNATGWSSPRSASTISVVSNKLRSTADSTATFGSVITLTGLVISKLYSISGSATSNNSGVIIRFRVGDDGTLTSYVLAKEAAGGASIDSHFVATATTMYVGTINTGHNAGDYVDIDAGISLKSVTNVITYENIPESARYTFTQFDNILLGSEFLNNNTFTNGTTDWYSPRSNSSLSIINNNLVVTPDIANTYGVAQQLDNLVVGDIYKVTASVSLSQVNSLISFRVAGLSDLNSSVIDITETGSVVIDSTFAATATTMYVGVIVGAPTPIIGDTITINAGISVRRKIEVAPQITPVTQGMTLTEAWTVRGDGYDGLSESTVASVRVDAVISNTDDGILMEAGATGSGLVLYVYDGVLYFQCGNGSAFGTASNRAETSYTLPVGEFNYIIEWSATNTNNSVLYVNGVSVDSQSFSNYLLSGSNDGTFGEVENSVAVNRGGWTGDADGVYTNTITKCDIFDGQVTADV
jgi:hypothetical protein